MLRTSRHNHKSWEEHLDRAQPKTRPKQMLQLLDSTGLKHLLLGVL
ncbi:hypothetical protein MH117_17320 [Paenibacillus sp. ACRRX]|nr:hypothetical protein [Paenibacillus sp. ACRRX]MCG7409180.1 hypothetical protein [Paenibacillus sp. ACRRX]